MKVRELLEAVTGDVLSSVLTPEVMQRKRELIIKTLIAELDNDDLETLVAQLQDKVLTPEEVRERLELIVRLLPKAMGATVNGVHHPYIYAEEDVTGGRSASLAHRLNGNWIVNDFQEYEKEFEDEEEAVHHLIASWRKIMAEKS